MVEEYDCLIVGGIEFYDDRENHEPLSQDEDPTFFDYTWQPTYQTKLEEE